MAYFEIMKEGNFKGCKYVITHTDDGRYNWIVDMLKSRKIIFTMRSIMMF